MKRLLPLLLVLLISACGNNRVSKGIAEEDLVGSWINNGTCYAGSVITGSTVFIFNGDKTFVALDKAKGMPTITENGLWQISGDTLKMKYSNNKPLRSDIISYKERTGGNKDFLKPKSDDTIGFVAWNYKLTGNKLILDGSSHGYTGPCELARD
jgi:hypothetical protein